MDTKLTKEKKGVMKKFFIGLTLVLLSIGPLFAATNDAIVFEGGDVRIIGSGNGLVFPDGSIQDKATVKGPAGIRERQGLKD